MKSLFKLFNPKMNKIKIIIQKEYLFRVKSRTFLLSTFLTPLGIILIMGISILASNWNQAEKFEIYLEDTSGVFLEPLQGLRGDLSFTGGKGLSEAEKNNWLKAEKQRGYIICDTAWISKKPMVELVSANNLGLHMKETIEDSLTRLIRNLRMERAGIAPEQAQLLKGEAHLKTLKLTEAGTQRSSTGVAAMIGYAMGILIYIFMFTYGMIVMRGVMEEKTNRLVEVIISSVNPFELMMGKIISIGGVGLTQVLIWVITLTALFAIASPMLSELNTTTSQTMAVTAMADSKSNVMAEEIAAGIQQFNPWLIVWFIFYFLGGYLLYGSLFAAVGSAVDQESDSQQLMWPITFPLVIPMLFLGNVIQQPDGPLAIALSLIPFFSPTIMLVRLASVEVPWYELLLSVVLLLGTVAGMIWVAARIYRIGIFLYGKKPSMKEVARWIFIPPHS